MPWSIVIKNLAMLALKREYEVNQRKIYKGVGYFPVMYFVSVAPAFFLLVGISIFASVGVAQYYPEYLYPRELAIAFAEASILVSLIMFLLFKMILKGIMIKGSKKSKKRAILKLEEKIRKPFSPFINQLKNEHNLIRESLSNQRD